MTSRKPLRTRTYLLGLFGVWVAGTSGGGGAGAGAAAGGGGGGGRGRAGVAPPAVGEARGERPRATRRPCRAHSAAPRLVSGGTVGPRAAEGLPVVRCADEGHGDRAGQYIFFALVADG